MLLSARAQAALSAADRALQRLVRTGAAVRYKVMKNWGVIGGLAAALAAGIYVIWGPITERKKRRKGLVPGLVNLGNTCFMNSLLQGLSACPAFVTWLEEFTTQYSRDQTEPPAQQYLSLTLLHLLKALSCQEVTDEDVLDASCLLDVLRTYRWQISSFEEQDAHELFHIITASLEDERDRQPQVTPLFDVQALEQQSEVTPRQTTCHTRGTPHPASKHWKSQHPFHGRLTSNMVCKHCEHQGHPLTLDHCLHHFISSESVRDVVCDNCTKPSGALPTAVPASVPDGSQRDPERGAGRASEDDIRQAAQAREAPAVPVHPPPAPELVQPRDAPEAPRARAVQRVPDDGHLQVPPPGPQAPRAQLPAGRRSRPRPGARSPQACSESAQGPQDTDLHERRLLLPVFAAHPAKPSALPFASGSRLQLLHVPLPADGSGRPPRRHALGPLRDLPTVPAIGQEPPGHQQPVAVGLRRHRPQGQPAGGPVVQRLPAVLRARALQAAAPEPGVQVGRMTRPRPGGMPS